MTTIDSEAMRKLEEALSLLTDVREALKGYEADLPQYGGWADPRGFEKTEKRAKAADAVDAINATLSNFRTAARQVTAIWEALGKPEAGASTLITWTHGRFSSFRGTAGGVELFSINWHTRNEDPNYFLNSVLPGVSMSRPEWKDDDEQHLMAVAEKLLTAWLAKVSGGAE
jgi:hypothetical protein